MDKDSVSKLFLKDDRICADLINFWLYNGREVVKAEQLISIDGEQIASSPIPGEDHFPRRRDILKRIVIKNDGQRSYMFFGVEHQSYIDNTMPLRMLEYDTMRYVRQMKELLRQKAEEQNTEGKNYRPKMTKNDKLPVVVTLVVYFGKAPWTGYRTLHEMLDENDPNVLAMTPDYKLNLLHIYAISPEEVKLFKSEFGSLVRFVEVADDKEKFIALTEEVGKLKQETADLINVLTGYQLVISEVDEEGMVNMCKAIDDIKLDSRMEEKKENAIGMKAEGLPTDMIARVLKVSEEMVKQWTAVAAFN